MPKKEQKKPAHHVITTNRRARVKYEILETLEAGMVLTGPEVKSVRAGRVNIQEGFVRLDDNEPYLWNAHITPYSHGSLHVEQEPLRKRKLLLNQQEIKRWAGRVSTKGLAVVPLEIYFNKKGYAKLKIGLGKGKRSIDRRDDIKRRTVDREMRRSFGEKQKIK